MSPLRGSPSNSRSLPTACAVGYKYFVGFANSLTIKFDNPGSNRALQLGRDPQIGRLFF